ncbi:MAG: phosphatidate cytidylyltransferase [Rhodocyclaceae bacterium]
MTLPFSIFGGDAIATRHITLLLFAGIGVVLLLASILGPVLGRRLGTDHRLVRNLNARARTWWIIAIVTGVAFLGGHTGVVILFGLLSFYTLREFITLAPTQRGDHWPLVASFFVVLPLQYVFVWHEWWSAATIFVPVYAFLILPILACFGHDTARFIDRAAQTQWGLMICVYCISQLPALLVLRIPGYEGRNLLLVIFLVLIVQSGDLMQYLCGKLFGRHKIAPGLSSYRTVEGLAGGVAASTALGAALWWATPFTLWQAALAALAVAVMGCLGGLVMAAIKRDRGVKDWGNTLEGRGGMLDRFDSVCFAAPVFFHIVRYWMS